MPNHQECRDHWSILALYPRHGLIVHYDSLLHATANRSLLGIAANYLKLLTYFWMKEFAKNYEQATSRVYGKEGHSTLFSGMSFVG